MATDPAKPRVEKVLDDVPRSTGLSGPAHLLRLAGSDAPQLPRPADGGLPAGLAEFTNDGRFIRTIANPERRPLRLRRGHQARAEPDGHQQLHAAAELPQAAGEDGPEGLRQARWSSGTSRPASRSRSPRPALAPLEVRWSLKPEADHGFTNCALDNSLWLFQGKGDGSTAYEFKKVADTGALPADLRQSPDDRYLFVSCFGGNEIQQWDVTDPEHPKLFSSVSPGVQPNMMHVTGDGKRMYVTNSLLSTLDHSGRFWVRLVHVGRRRHES